jgi:aspartyl-tRNA(Asn)/glutamyl-tRNA(Gln) amidotransferase subunit A
MLDGLDRFWRARFREETRHLAPDRYELILAYIRKWIEAADNLDGRAVYTGFDQIIQMMDLGNRHFAGLDFLISPVAPETAFDAELPSPSNDPSRPFDHIGFTVAYNMTGQPAASINCGYSKAGLPIGLQIAGRRFDDLGVLELSRAYEALRPRQQEWPRPWPG